jgi:peptidoglycan hydrolase CwlO-like protein
MKEIYGSLIRIQSSIIMLHEPAMAISCCSLKEWWLTFVVIVTENEGCDQHEVQRALLCQSAGDPCNVHPALRDQCLVHRGRPVQSDNRPVHRASSSAPSLPSKLRHVHFADDTKMGNVLSKRHSDEQMRRKESYTAPYTGHVRRVGVLPLEPFDDQRHPCTWPNMKRNAFGPHSEEPPASSSSALPPPPTRSPPSPPISSHSPPSSLSSSHQPLSFRQSRSRFKLPFLPALPEDLPIVELPRRSQSAPPSPPKMDDRISLTDESRNKPLPVSPITPTTPRTPRTPRTSSTPASYRDGINRYFTARPDSRVPSPFTSSPASHRDGSLRHVPAPPESRNPPTPRRNIVNFGELPLKFQALQESFEANFPKLETIIADVKGMEERVDIIDKKAASIQRDLVTGLEIIDQNILDVKRHDKSIDNFEEKVHSLEYGLKNVDRKFDVINYKVERVDKNVQIVDNYIATVNQKVQMVNTRVEDAKDRAKDANNKVDKKVDAVANDLEKKVDALHENLAKKLEDLDKKLEDVDKKADAAIDKNLGKAKNLNKKIEDAIAKHVENFRKEHEESLKAHLRSVDRLEGRLDDVALWKEEEMAAHVTWWQQRFEALRAHVGEVHTAWDRERDELLEEHGRLSRQMDAGRQEVSAASTDLDLLESEISLLKVENRRLTRMMTRVLVGLKLQGPENELSDELVAGEALPLATEGGLEQVAVAPGTPPATGGVSSGAASGSSTPTA